MTGKGLRHAMLRVQATARIKFSAEAESEIEIRMQTILRILRPDQELNKSYDEALNLIGDDEIMPPAVETLIGEIEIIRQQQSPFVAGKTA